MRKEQAGQTWPTTALIHEAYLRLIDVRQIEWQNRARFFGGAARVQRRSRADTARSRKAYEDFLAVWKEDDADLPILRAAEREYELAAKR